MNLQQGHHHGTLIPRSYVCVCVCVVLSQVCPEQGEAWGMGMTVALLLEVNVGGWGE